MPAVSNARHQERKIQTSDNNIVSFSEHYEREERSPWKITSLLRHEKPLQWAATTVLDAVEVVYGQMTPA